MLILHIKRKWFQMISSGVKQEEYRKYSQYYIARLKGMGAGGVVRFVNGYSGLSGWFDIPCLGMTVTSKSIHPEWGEQKGLHFVISLGIPGKMHDGHDGQKWNIV